MRIFVVHFRASFFFFISLYILSIEDRSNYIPSLPLVDLLLQFFFCVFLFFFCVWGGGSSSSKVRRATSEHYTIRFIMARDINAAYRRPAFEYLPTYRLISSTYPIYLITRPGLSFLTILPNRMKDNARIMV